MKPERRRSPGDERAEECERDHVRGEMAQVCVSVDARQERPRTDGHPRIEDEQNTFDHADQTDDLLENEDDDHHSQRLQGWPAGEGHTPSGDRGSKTPCGQRGDTLVGWPASTDDLGGSGARQPIRIEPQRRV